MRRRLPPPNDRKSYIQVALVAFGVGIFTSFFLTAHILAAIEAVLLVISGISFLRGE